MSNTKQTFIKGAAVLAAAIVIIKFVGFLFKVPLTYLINEEGMGLFGYAYQIYTIMFIIATAGFPIAISKMVAESEAHGNHGDTGRILEIAWFTLGFIGIAGSTLLFVYAKPLANMLGNEDAALGITVIAPAVFFVSLVAVFRGFFQGKQNMYPTAISEIVEAAAKLIIGLFLANLVMSMSIDPDMSKPIDFINKTVASLYDAQQYSYSGALFGVTSGTVLALVFLLITFIVYRRRNKNINMLATRSRRSLLNELVAIAIPITIGAAVASLTNLIDLFTITNRLQVNELIFDKYSQLFAEGTTFAEKVIENGWTGAELIEKKASALFGMYTGYALTMFNLPLAAVTPLSISVVPAIAKAQAMRNLKESRRITDAVMRFTALFALPCAAGLFALAAPILDLLFSNSNSQSLLQTLSFGIAFVSLVSVTNAIHQAYGNVYVPVKNMIAGGVVKLLCNYYLIPIWGIDAAPFSTTLCYGIIIVLNMLALAKKTGASIRLYRGIIAPLMSSVAMGFSAVLIYNTLCMILPDKLAVLGAMAFAAVIYVLLVFVTGCVDRDDVRILPKGDRLEEILMKMRLLK